MTAVNGIIGLQIAVQHVLYGDELGSQPALKCLFLPVSILLCNLQFSFERILLMILFSRLEILLEQNEGPVSVFDFD